MRRLPREEPPRKTASRACAQPLSSMAREIAAVRERRTLHARLERGNMRRRIGELLGWLLLSNGCGAPDTPCGPTRARVERVLDGDTVVLEGGEHVRYLLVDTPERGGATPACHAEEAYAFNRREVLGQEVSLRYSQVCRDRYGRLLAFVRRGETELSERLLSEGQGCLLFIPPAGEERHSALRALEREARREKRGLWSHCVPSHCEP